LFVVQQPLTTQEPLMRVREAMTRDVFVARPDQTLLEAARAMGEIDIGALPVGENDRLVGMITDRDIAVRAVARNKGPLTPVREVMTRDVKFCYEDEDAGHVARNMAELRVRRLPVLDRDKRLVGILALSDLATQAGARPAAQALEGISQPGGQHSQRVA
jgi:CBS domain-containing protein